MCSGKEVPVWSLKRPHVAVLLLLYREGEVLLADISDVLGSKSSYWVNTVINDLKEMGLIEERRIRRFRLFSLTEKGRGIAAQLRRISEMLREDGRVLPP